jgi:hypothetical protein
VGIGKPLDFAAGRETDARARGYAKGALAANTCKDGLLGNTYRAKYTTTGTYTGNTNGRPRHDATRQNGRHEHVTT